MTEYLVQEPGGHVYVATPDLRNRSDMKPYSPESEVGATEPLEGATRDPDAEMRSMLEGMTKSEIGSYALEQFGVELGRRQPKTKMIEQVVSLR